MSLHIGIDYTAAIVQGGGIGRFTRELVRALIDADGQYRFHLFSAKQPVITSYSIHYTKLYESARIWVALFIDQGTTEFR